MTNKVWSEELSDWYFLEGEIYIISDAPGAELRIKEHPEIKTLSLAELEARRSGNSPKG